MYLERAARLQMRASIYGEPKMVPHELALAAHDYLLKPRVVHATFEYWHRKADRAYGPLPDQKMGGLINDDAHGHTVWHVDGTL